jgi:hypothetical protein
MDNIIEPNDSFDFSKLSLAQPNSIPGNAYFTRILFENNPLYLQSPKSSTRQGFIKTGKKINCDLMFENSEEHFIRWLEGLETRCQELIYEKSGEWFQNSLELVDIESAFNSPMKSFKSGKYYLVRTNIKVNSLTNSALIKIYNENETPLTLDDITSESNIISILEIQGIKFTTRNFQIEIELKQVMLLNKDILFENCLIKKKTSTKSNDTTQLIQNNDNAIQPSLKENDLNELADSILEDIEVQVSSNQEKIEEREVDVENNVDENSIPQVDSQNNDNNSLEIELSLKENVDNDINDQIEIDAQNADTFEKETPIILNEQITDLEEVNFGLDLENSLDSITLKKPNEVYYEMYKQAREKAKNAKKESLLAFLEAKNIKQTYMLEDIDSSDESTFSDEEDFEKENFY